MYIARVIDLSMDNRIAWVIDCKEDQDRQIKNIHMSKGVDFINI